MWRFCTYHQHVRPDGNVGQANYAAAKLAITALSKSIALDMQRYNVRSNCLAE
jgi:NAD(P)-dependent dehydrogenase (short-subunit alcohol dehydrogenase family)